MASDAVVSRLSRAATGATVGAEEIDRALRDAVDDIARHAGEADGGTGTTVTGAALTAVGGGPCWSIFNIGDSRVYLWIQGSLVQLTVDHSIVQELVDAGLITRDEADVHPHGNVITRAVGFHEAPVPDYRLVPVIALPAADLLRRADEGAHRRRTRSPPRQRVDRARGGRRAGGRRPRKRRPRQHHGHRRRRARGDGGPGLIR
ncbi:hypothetical protein Q0F99_00050 [Rathayibacter oskolensis]|uniref:PP2C family protein-serine/threonine phosphatase n=1 Tax=Rathayibacter oskolensis TaxID=1891671 RepID=UPI00265E6E68|nr:hypothetical protein [Rathayibacter oskolensis]WKK71668.1 hypothetical protein Q0F99_00050 [Rathayibacter oskolensis]